MSRDTFTDIFVFIMYADDLFFSSFFFFVFILPEGKVFPSRNLDHSLSLIILIIDVFFDIYIKEIPPYFRFFFFFFSYLLRSFFTLSFNSIIPIPFSSVLLLPFCMPTLCNFGILVLLVMPGSLLRSLSSVGLLRTILEEYF